MFWKVSRYIGYDLLEKLFLMVKFIEDWIIVYEVSILVNSFVIVLSYPMLILSIIFRFEHFRYGISNLMIYDLCQFFLTVQK